ncbi:MAG TPA: hypothetical protein VGP93_12475 [Polyangiaceae bacterium]|nr:hypothetical protein [Polyangiaceae bacterium]
MLRWILILLALLAVALPARADFRKAPPGKAAALLAGLSDGPLTFRPAQVGDHNLIFVLHDGVADVGRLWLENADFEPVPTRFRTSSFSVSIGIFNNREGAVERLIEAAHVVARNDDGTFRRLGHGQIGKPPPWTLLWATVTGSLLAALGAAWKRRRTLEVEVAVRFTHALPAAIQTTIFSYWALYSVQVRAHLPFLAAQLVLAFALDCALQIARTGRYQLGLAPVPIVLSMNLFVWFPSALVATLAVTLAITSKVLFTRANGRHIFNPSGFALAVVGLLSLSRWSQLNYGGLFHLMNLAPSLRELILILSLVPLTRIPLVLVSIGTVFGLTWVPGLSPAFQPQAILAFTLLYTDPATVPRSGGGRLLFGTFIGIYSVLCTRLLFDAGYPDDFAKVFPLPIANLLVPRFDALAHRIGEVLPLGLLRGTDPLAPRFNLVHVALWLLLVIRPVSGSKQVDFEAALHWTLGTHGVIRGRDDVPRCADNAAWCRPFQVLDEIRRWTR